MCLNMNPLVVAAVLVLVLGYCVMRDDGRRERNAVRTFDSVVTGEAKIARGFGLVSVDGGAAHRIGVHVVCDREAQSLTAFLHFGPFPAGKTVQPMVRRPSGGIVRFGTAVAAGRGALSGFPSPVLSDTAEVLRFVAVAFRHGAVITNGHGEIRNRISVAKNEDARALMSICAGS